MKCGCRFPAKLSTLAGAFAAIVAGTGEAHAQAAPPQSLQVSPLPHIMPQTPPELGAGLPNFQPLTTEGALPNASIHIGSVTVIGATAFTPARLNTITAGLAGSFVPLAKIEAARRALVALYRNQGFILTTVSMNIDAQGDVQFIVTEGHVVAVELSQNIGPAGTMVLAFLDHLTEERPVSEGALERWLLLAQQVPGVSVHAVLQADSDDPGALTLVAEVTKQNVSAVVTADDRGFRDTGPAEGLAVADLNSVTQFGDQTEVSLFHTSGGTDNFGQVSESFFLGKSGLRAELYGAAGRAWPGGPLRSIGYESNISLFGGYLSYPVLLRRNEALNVAINFDASQDEINTAGLRTSFDSLRVVRFSTHYAWLDLWAGNTRDALNVINVRESDGIPGFGASRDSRRFGEAGRFDEKPDFWKLDGSISRTQTLFTPVPEANVALHLEMGGQYTTDILPSEEEFSLGGSRFTRGFYSGEVSGDKAAYATAELQLNTGYSWTVLHQDFDIGAQFYGFYDWGESWPNLAADAAVRVASAGGGVRLGLTRYLEIDGEAVERLTTRLGGSAPSSLPLAETVLYWGITARY